MSVINKPRIVVKIHGEYGEPGSLTGSHGSTKTVPGFSLDVGKLYWYSFSHNTYILPLEPPTFNMTIYAGHIDGNGTGHEEEPIHYWCQKVWDLKTRAVSVISLIDGGIFPVEI